MFVIIKNEMFVIMVDISPVPCYTMLAVSIAWQYLQGKEENPSLTHSVDNTFTVNGSMRKELNIISDNEVILF